MPDFKSYLKEVQQPQTDFKSYLAELQPQEPSLGTKLEAGVQGLGDSLSLGYLPQLQALASEVIQPHGLLANPSDIQNEELEKQGFTVSEPEPDYISRRDAMLERQNRLQQQAPDAFQTGEIAGAVASAPLVGKAAGRLGLIAAGGLEGGLRNPGDQVGEISDLQLTERLPNALTGGALGGLLSGGGKVLQKTGQALQPEVLKSVNSQGSFDRFTSDVLRGAKSGAATAGVGALVGGALGGGDLEDLARGAAIGLGAKGAHYLTRNAIAPAIDKGAHALGRGLEKLPNGLLKIPTATGEFIQATPSGAALLEKLRAANE